MKAVILAAGYATRLYPLTINTPKPLLPVGKKLVIEHIIERAGKIDEVNEFIIVTNQKFYSNFKNWLKGFKFPKPIEILNDKTLSNKDRLGAIKDIEFAIIEKKLNCDLLVIAGDNLFDDDLQDFINFSKENFPYASIGLFDVKDIEAAKKFGVVEIDDNNQIINFAEKPVAPKSTLAAKCLYLFPKEKLSKIGQYVQEGNVRDAPGNYIEWLSGEDKVFGFVFKDDWYDIGDIASYKQAKQAYQLKGE